MDDYNDDTSLLRLLRKGTYYTYIGLYLVEQSFRILRNYFQFSSYFFAIQMWTSNRGTTHCVDDVIEMNNIINKDELKNNYISTKITDLEEYANIMNSSACIYSNGYYGFVIFVKEQLYINDCRSNELNMELFSFIKNCCKKPTVS